MHGTGFYSGSLLAAAPLMRNAALFRQPPDWERFSYRLEGAVAVVPVIGVLSRPAASRAQRELGAAMSDPAASAVVLEIDSFGGEPAAAIPLAEAIAQARTAKPFVAQVNPRAVGAAYLVAAAAGEIVCTPSGEVGGLGVVAMHVDRRAAFSKAGVDVTLLSAGLYKAELSDAAGLTDGARKALQQRVDAQHDLMVERVAQYRKTTVYAVRDRYGQGRELGAERALQLKMVDGLGSLDATVARLNRGSRQSLRAAQAFLARITGARR